MSPLYLAALDYLQYIAYNRPTDVEAFSCCADAIPFTTADVNFNTLVEIAPDVMARKYGKWHVSECVIFTWGERQIRFTHDGTKNVKLTLFTLKDKWLGSHTLYNIGSPTQLRMDNVMTELLSEERKRAHVTIREVQKYNKSKQKYDRLKELWNINPRT
ncbi:hypothetical protein Xoosp13_128 [Xanthomonas phage Xoo-sp13]|nr:hypothetical protein Xoosp13_128 [Xanthomonas phage Xoo-sp13]